MSRSPTGLACPACGSRRFAKLFEATDRLYQTTNTQFEVVECSGCQLIRLYPWPGAAELNTYYPANYWLAPGPSSADRLGEKYRRFVLRDHLAFVLRALAQGGPLLDVGCGGGLFPRLLLDRGHRAFGLDYTQQAAEVAWHSNRVPIVRADLANSPFAPESFGVITMFHVLEHLYDPASYLQAAYMLLKPGGRLVVQVPNASCWQFLLFAERWNGIDVPRHLINFRASDLTSLIEQCGFSVARLKYFSLRDNPAGLATTLAPSLDPMSRRVRRVAEKPAKRLLKDLSYLALVAAAVPFTLLEAACGAGSTVMIEAVKPQ